MSSLALPFDALTYARELEEAGFTRAQAEVQTRIFHDQSEAQARLIRELVEAETAILQSNLEKSDEARRRELATRGDIYDTRLEIEKVRAEVEKVRAELKTDIEKVRAEVEKVRAELKGDIERVRAELKGDIERVHAELKGDIERLHAEVEKARTEARINNESLRYSLLKWQIGIALAQFACMALMAAMMFKGFGWLD